jgi:hypothetical protein
MNWRLWILIFVMLAAFDGAIRWRERSRRTQSPEVDRALVEPSQLERARRIVIREKPQSKVLHSDDDGFEVRRVADKDAPIRETVLERRDDARWVVANGHGFDADAEWLGLTMRDLSQGRLMRHVTDDSGMMESLGLGVAEVRIEDEAGRVVRQLEFGRKDGGEMYQLVRVDGADAFVAKHQAEIVGDPLSWIDSRVLRCAPAEVAEIEIPFRTGDDAPLTLRRAGPGEPLLAAGEISADAERVSRWAERLLRRFAAEPAVLVLDRDAPALAAAREHVVASLRLRLFDGCECKLVYGMVPSDSNSYGQLDETLRDDLVFAFHECSGPEDDVRGHEAGAGLGYSRNAIIEFLPKSRSVLAAEEPDESPDD